jgi:hypothetical protein
MTEPFTEEQVLIDQVRYDESLAVDQGHGRQLFQVENVILHEVQQDDWFQHDRKDEPAFVAGLKLRDPGFVAVKEITSLGERASDGREKCRITYVPQD